MGKKWILVVLLVIAFPLAYYLFWPSDEARIRKLVRDGAAAAEREDTDEIMSFVSFSYADDAGMNYMLLRRFLEREFAAHSDIDVEYEALEVDVSERTARASVGMRVLATLGGQRGYVFGDLNEAARLTLSLEKGTTGGWKVTEAVFGRKGGRR